MLHVWVLQGIHNVCCISKQFVKLSVQQFNVICGVGRIRLFEDAEAGRHIAGQAGRPWVLIGFSRHSHLSGSQRRDNIFINVLTARGFLGFPETGTDTTPSEVASGPTPVGKPGKRSVRNNERHKINICYRSVLLGAPTFLYCGMPSALRES